MLHIDLPTRADILRLTGTRGQPAVTLYLSTTPLTQDAQADRIALRNLAADAVAQLAAADTPKRAIWPIESALAEIADDDGFWAHQANALAIFATPDTVQTFRLPSRLTSAVHVSDRFHIKPLLRAVTFPHEAYVLAIGMGAVRLIEVTADLPPHPVAVPGLPRDMADALGRRSHGARDKPGRTGEPTSEHALMTRYAREVDAALRPVLSGHESPLIIAAAEPMASLTRAVSSYPHTADEVIAGSPDHRPDHELAAAARGILDRVYAAQIDTLKALYAAREAQGRATTDIAQAARAATFGAVETLIVDMDVTVPGSVDADGAVTFSEVDDAETYGVVDEIVTRALHAGARLVSARKADIPGGGALAAVLRYAV
jgi:hypothetical protein